MKKLVQVPDFKKVRFFDTRLRLKFESAIDDESCIELLANVMAKSLGKLQPLASKEEARPSSLGNNPKLERSRRVRFDISDSNTLTLAFGSKVSSGEISGYINDVFETALELKRLQVSQFDFADIIHIFDLKFVGNHHALLAKTYYGESVLEHVFPIKDFTHGSISIGGVVSGNPDRQCIVYISAKTSVTEILSGKYDPDDLIDIIIGYAQLRNIHPKDISNFLAGLLYDAREYLVSYVLDKVLKPLDEEVAKQEEHSK